MYTYSIDVVLGFLFLSFKYSMHFISLEGNGNLRKSWDFYNR